MCSGETPMAHRYSPTTTAPTRKNKCDQCGKVHYDSNYQVCRECGEHL